MKRRKRIRRIVLNATGILVFVVMVFPVYWMVSTSFKRGSDVLTQFLIVPMGMVIRGVIPLPGGIGGAEIGYGKLYEWVESVL